MKRTKYSESYYRIYRIWSGMKQRCYNQKSPEYKWYGGKGIAVCDEWLHDFKAFYNWAITNGYADDLTIDRKDNSKGYSPDNCRWATNKEQHNNQSNNVKITYNNKTQTLKQWSEELNVNYSTLRMRIERGWSIERALGTP